MAGGKKTAAARRAWICFEDEAGQSLRPPVGRTWGRRGRTPVVRVRGGGHGRISIAGLVCTRPGETRRLFCRLRRHTGRAGEPKAMTRRDYLSLLDTAHQRLDGPMVVIWDRLSSHHSAAMRRSLARRPWLSAVELPAYAPDLNPVEGVWSHLKAGIVELAPCGLDTLAATIRSHLKHLQHRPDTLDGYITETGLTLQPNPSH